MSYSGGGGTLTLPSPTHTHHVDVTSAVRSLRRSLSRSPSKFRFVTSRSASSSPVSVHSPSPKSSGKSSDESNAPSSTPNQTPSPLARPFPPSVKLSLRSATRPKMTSPRSSFSRTSPKSPMKRALSETSDSGNSARRSSRDSQGVPESSKTRSSSPPTRTSLDKDGDREMPQFEIAVPVNQALSRFTDEGHDFSASFSGTSSPLKRSDAIMNLDQASLGSPVAKRRSLHASANSCHEFSVFDQGNTSANFDIHDESNQEQESTPLSFTAGNPSLVATLGAMPRRSSSLRKSTLQQRHGDKQTSWGRKHAAQLELARLNNADFTSDMSTPVATKNRPRLSLDQFLPPPPRDSPFNNQGSLPNPSAHMLPPPQERQAHPLSRTMTQSSSNSSICMEDDNSPTHVPVHFRQHSRPRIDFSKSLPAGALRPAMLAAIANEESDSFSTPPNYKAVKPLPAAFMSTGLISKVNRFPEEPRPAHGAKGQMPDTPCKKQANIFSTYPQPVPGSAIAKARHIRHSFGTPSTPFNPHGGGGPKTRSIFSKGSVFGGSFGHGKLSRRGSFLSTDGDNTGSSPLSDEKQDCEMTGDDDFPPTPTKQALNSSDPVEEPSPMKPFSLRGLPSSTSVINMNTLSNNTFKSSKSNVPHTDSMHSLAQDGSPTTSSFRMSSRHQSSFHKSRSLRGSSMFMPGSLISESSPKSYTLPSIKLDPANSGFVVPASPLDHVDFTESLPPRTPSTSHPNAMIPPDPSGLSISNHKDDQMKGLFNNKGSMHPPATPTTARESLSQFGERRLSVTPINNSFSPDVDDALVSRFDKVEMVGTGEFSTVYKVSAPPATAATTSTMLQFASSGSPLADKSSPMIVHEQVFAVKKSRQAYQGNKDRLRKLREVEVLKALNNHDHIVHYIDHWEVKDHLYIQTEYCEEGSLDAFLSQVGRKGRLDDFRIWKVMLEISQGLKYIHDSGFIHLDLKPANILITFEGALRIADFGMAVSWPAPADIEGEGDREYMGPEVLLGKYDKPADVFALGLIMLEIAGNVQLPDNGPTWQRLRCGDMSDVPSLTFSTATTIVRDATGIPVDESDTSMDSFNFDEDTDVDFGSHESFGSQMFGHHKRHSMPTIGSPSHNAANLFGSTRRGELASAPDFMRDQQHENALDNVVRWMISPETSNRPTIHEVIASPAVQWVESRRRAGATVFEGNWGPADEILADDVEMMDI